MNLYHDELGRFCSRGAMISRKHTLMEDGRYEEADQVDLGLRNADLTKDNPAARKRENIIKQAYRAAVKNGNEESIAALRKEYLSTDEGILELQTEGKHTLAKAHFMRRERLAVKARKDARAQKTPLRLGLDLDNTSGDFTQIMRDHVAAERGMTKEEAIAQLPDPAYYSFAQSGWFKDTTEFLQALRSAEEQGRYRDMKPYENFKKNIKTLVANGDVELHVITAREQEWNADTRAWLRKHKVPFKTITHTESKEDIQHIDAYIDDSDKQLKTLSAHGRTVIAFDNLYNQGIETPYRVKHWDEVPAVIQQIRAKTLETSHQA